MTWVRERLTLIRLFLSEGWRSALVLVLLLIDGVIPAATAVVTGWLVATVVDAVGHGDAALGRIAPPLITLGAILVGGQLLAGIAGTVTQDVGRRIDGRVRMRIRDAALAPSTVAHLDEQNFVEDMSRASDLTPFQGRVRSPAAAAVGQVSLLFSGFSAVVATAVLARYSITLALGVLAGTWITRTITRFQWMRLANAIDGGLPAKRGVEYWTRLVSEATDAKEIRLFDLGAWVSGRRRAANLAWKRLRRSAAKETKSGYIHGTH